MAIMELFRCPKIMEEDEFDEEKGEDVRKRIDE